MATKITSPAFGCFRAYSYVLFTRFNDTVQVEHIQMIDGINESKQEKT